MFDRILVRNIFIERENIVGLNNWILTQQFHKCIKHYINKMRETRIVSILILI